MNRKAFFGLSLAVLLFLVLVTPVFLFAADEGLVPCDGTDCEFKHIIILVNNLINFAIVNIAIPGSALFFAWAGFLYLTAAGDSSKISMAHSIFKNVFWGLIIALSSWLIVNLVTTVLTGKSADSFFRPW